MGGYSQEKEFSLVSYELYQYLRDHTKGFSELAAFPAVETGFGVRRSGSSEPAQGYPGEFVSGNYFTMFGIRAYGGRLLAASDDRPGAPPSFGRSSRCRASGPMPRQPTRVARHTPVSDRAQNRLRRKRLGAPETDRTSDTRLRRLRSPATAKMWELRKGLMHPLVRESLQGKCGR